VVLSGFLEQTGMRNQLRDKMILCRDRIAKVQNMRRGTMEMINCKMHMLLRIWNREQNAMGMIAIKSKDKKQRQLVSELSMIKDEVKLALLKSYLYLCSIRHSLAFF
jgi:hypothetical protein